jgi:hypothetical protein
MAGKYALTSTVKNVNTSGGISGSVLLPSLPWNFAAKVAVVT